jgi:hypothetical protein
MAGGRGRGRPSTKAKATTSEPKCASCDGISLDNIIKTARDCMCSKKVQAIQEEGWATVDEDSDITSALMKKARINSDVQYVSPSSEEALPEEDNLVDEDLSEIPTPVPSKKKNSKGAAIKNAVKNQYGDPEGRWPFLPRVSSY